MEKHISFTIVTRNAKNRRKDATCETGAHMCGKYSYNYWT